jgi:hypothetical protein
MRYALGPYWVDVSTWPPHWQAYAAATLAPLPQPHARAFLDVRCTGLGQSVDDSYDVAVEDLRIHGDGTHYEVRAASVHADYHLDTHRLDVNVLAHADHAHITLGNALRAAASVAMPLCFDGLMLHSSSVVLDDEGLVFAGLSTAGKTTMALGFVEGQFLSDDISLVMHLSTKPTLVESPFFGSAGRRGFALNAPLRGLALLGKDPQETRIGTIGRASAAVELMRHVVCFSEDGAVGAAIMARVDALTQGVAIRRLWRFLDEPSDSVGRKLLRAL